VSIGLPQGGFLHKSIDHIQIYLKSDDTLGDELPTFTILTPRLRDRYENKEHGPRSKYKRAPLNTISMLVIKSKIQSPLQYLTCIALHFIVIT
jgi:hypothetical protein